MTNIFYDGTGKTIEIETEMPDVPILIDQCPAIYIESSVPIGSLTKNNKSNGTLTLVDNSKSKIKNMPITTKLQGNTAIHYEKKSLNITFFEDDARKEKKKLTFNDWKPTDKVHIKANPSDSSFVRNSVCAKIAKFMFGGNYPKHARGIVDSFPCILYYNDVFQGCYTFNLPQDEDLFDMDKKSITNVVWRCNSNTETWKNISAWEIRSGNENLDGVTDSFTALLAIMADTENLTKEIVESHFDKKSLLGYMMFCQIGKLADQMGNNWTMGTWDGVTWYTFAYDMDYGFGTHFGNVATVAQGDNLSGEDNTFFAKINTLYADEMPTVYADIRKLGVDADMLYRYFADFKSKYGITNINADYARWAGGGHGTSKVYGGQTQYSKTKDIYHLKSWMPSRIAYLDTLYGYSE